MEPYILLTALVLYLAYLKLAPWLYRLTPDERASLRAKHEQQSRKGALRDSLLGVLFVLSIVAVSFFGGIYVGNGVYKLVKSSYWLAGNPLCLVEPTWFVIHVTVGFLLFIALTLTAWVLAGCFHTDFQEYLEICAVASGYRVGPVLLWTIVPWVLLLCVFLVFACNNYAAAFPNRLELNGFWSLGGVSYAYEDVTAIEQMSIKHTDDQRKQRDIPAWKIQLSDGHTWSTQSNIAVEVNPQQLKSHEALARIVSERSGRPIVKVGDRK
jgi:hypothetical protein